MFKASEVSMGFLRSLYYEQVKKSIADAKRREAKEKMEQANAERDRAKQRRMEAAAFRKNPNRNRRPQMHPTRRQPRQQQTAAYDMNDFRDALEELE
jgi:hypothetical protein